MIIFTVKERQEVLIEQFGRYVRSVKSPGLHAMMPWQKVAARVSTEIFQIGDDLKTKTKDDIFVEMPLKMQLQVVDSKKFHYETNAPIEQVKARVAATVKQLTSHMDFAEIFQTREALSEQAREKVGKEVEDIYGVKLVDVIVDQPQASQDIQNRYNAVKASDMDRQAQRNAAEAEKVTSIMRAEADKQGRILRGQGAAGERGAILEGYADQFNEIVKKGLPPEMAQEIIKIAMINDTIRDAASKGNLIITTTNANDMLSQIQTLGKTIKPANDLGATPAHKDQGPKFGG